MSAIANQASNPASKTVPSAAMPDYRPLWQWYERGLWGDCRPLLNDWLETLPDDEKGGENAIAPDVSNPTLLRWRYNIEAGEQYREERPDEALPWTITATKKIRRVLKRVRSVPPQAEPSADDNASQSGTQEEHPNEESQCTGTATKKCCIA